MNKEITNELEVALKMLDKNLGKNKSMEEFEKSSDEFEFIVEQGHIKNLGNRLFSVLNRENPRNMMFNTK